MNHFDTVTAVDLFPTDQARIAWQTVMPREAQTYPLLMHGILAISAVHLSCLDASRTAVFRIRALHHQNTAVLMYRGALSTMTKKNAHALFGFSMILAILTFASPRLSAIPPTVDDVLEKLNLMHGSMIVWQLETQSIQSSSMAALLPTMMISQGSDIDPRIAAGLDALEAFVEEPILVSTVKLLRLCVGLAFAAPDEVPMSARWVAEAEEGFWVRCRAHDTKALLVLAHYALVLRHYRQVWWSTGWSEVLVNAVGRAFSEDEKDFVGWSEKVGFLLHA